MSITKKLVTAIRGLFTRTGESLVNQNQIGIFEQEIKDTENKIREAKENLVTLMTERVGLEREVDKAKAKIDEFSSHIKGLMSDGVQRSKKTSNKQLAHDIATNIIGLEKEVEMKGGVLSQLIERVSELQGFINSAESIIVEQRTELMTIKTTESVNQLTKDLNEKFSGGLIATSRESLEEIKKSQQRFSDEMSIRKKHVESPKSLEERIHEATGNSPKNDTTSVIDRIINS